MHDNLDHEAAFSPTITHDPEPAERQLGRPPAVLTAHATRAEDRAEADRQDAFDSAFAWHGTELHSFSSSRYGLFAQQRLSLGAPDLHQCLSDLDGFFPDACRILWLCSHLPADWSTLRCTPQRMQEEIDRWADANITGGEGAAAVLLAFRIYTAARTNEHEPAPAGKGHGDDLGN